MNRLPLLPPSSCFPLLLAASSLVFGGILAGCNPPASTLTSEGAREGKGEPPAYPLIVPPSVYSAIPEGRRDMVEAALREQKRERLFRTSALLPALEIVRTREREFKAAAKEAGIDLRLFQGLVVLECGGRDDAIDYMFRQGRGKRAHVGLGQIGSFEGRAAGLKVSPEHEARLKGEIRRSIRLVRDRYFDASIDRPAALDPAILNSFRRQIHIEREWRRVDERFDSMKNLAATARLLKGRMKTYRGDVTLVIASYHAGGGNIGKALRLYKKSNGETARPTFWHLYEDKDGPVYELMNGWSDSSRNYLPTVVAAADLVEKYLNRPGEFREEYRYWGPEDASERLAGVPYIAAES